MDVVLLHDWLTSYRGGERVLEVFCELFPAATIYTLIHAPGSTSSLIEQHPVRTSWLDHVPGVHRHYRKFLPLFPVTVDLMKIRDRADLVLSSCHCVIKGVKKPANARHIAYIHSPMRYIYDQFDNYFGPGKASLLVRLAARLCRPYLRRWDLRSNANVDVMVANSRFVAQRIKTCYQIDAAVVHPFVDLADFAAVQAQPPEKEDFYLMVTAFAPNKRVDLAIEAFNTMGLPLKIIGAGQDENWLKAMAGTSIDFLGAQSRDNVVDHMARARAFVFPGVEDFGITPLEAMASGTPVIAFRQGGVLETLDESVGHFFDRADKTALMEAVRQFERRHYQRNALYERARQFSRDKFKAGISALISATMEAKL